MRTPQSTTEPSMAPTSPETDREALVALYSATGGPNWFRNDNWLSVKPTGEWEGVTTNDDRRVTKLALGSKNLRGEIPPELGSLSNLYDLKLNSNELSGEIPPELGNLARLTYCWILHENQLSGEIPPELGNLGRLNLLVLHENQLSGEIPPELGNLARLTFAGPQTRTN